MDVREVEEITKFLEESGVCTDKLYLISVQAFKERFSEHFNLCKGAIRMGR